jgi:hypothetical protein
VWECHGARLHLLDINSRHAVFLEKPDGWKFSIFIKKPRWRKWGSHLGSLRWAAWCGVGEKA